MLSPFKITQTGKSLTLQIDNVARTNNQRLVFKKMLSEGNLVELIKYANSFKGKSNQYGYVDRIKSEGIDPLKSKSEGHYRSLFENMFRTDINHKPEGKHSDWIGIEIECCIPFRSTEFACSYRTCGSCEGNGCDDEGMTCERCEGSGETLRSGNSDEARDLLEDLVSKNKIKYCNVKDDGSIRVPNEQYFPVELTILTRLSRPDNLKKLCDLLATLKAKVNKSCGLHVHLDARHLCTSEVRAIGRKFTKVMPVMQAMIPATRRNNQYCRPAVSKFSGSRYYAVNLVASFLTCTQYLEFQFPLDR